MKDIQEGSPAQEIPLLTLNDRCDACGRAPCVRVMTKTGILDFCGHDFAKHETEIVSRGYEIWDERDRLLLRDSQMDMWSRSGNAKIR